MDGKIEQAIRDYYKQWEKEYTGDIFIDKYEWSEYEHMYRISLVQDNYIRPVLINIDIESDPSCNVSDDQLLIDKLIPELHKRQLSVVKYCKLKKVK